MRTLYITHNGLADYIGQSQVLPYLLGLANEGFAITVVSAEKFENASLRDGIRQKLVAAGIEWHFVSYHNRPPLISTVFDLWRMYRAVVRIVRGSPIALLHCRGFLTTYIGLIAKRRFTIPLIFDFRDFWPDRGIYSKRFKFVYRFFKRRECGMVRDSDHVVTLTESAKKILERECLGGQTRSVSERVTVIPTCVDVDLFDLSNLSAGARAEVRARLDLRADDLVFGYLGTFHEDYIPTEMFRAFKILQSLDCASKCLVVSPNDKAEIFAYAKKCGVDAASLRVVSAPRSEVPTLLSAFDLAVCFIRADRSTAGVFPTKLAELFACNIPVLVNSGVGDLDEIVRPEVNDSVLVHDFSDESLKTAIQQLLGIVRSAGRRGRVASMQFSLAEGVRRYHGVYSQFVAPAGRSRPTRTFD